MTLPEVVAKVRGTALKFRRTSWPDGDFCWVSNHRIAYHYADESAPMYSYPFTPSVDDVFALDYEIVEDV